MNAETDHVRKVFSASGNSSLKFQAQAVQMLLGDSNVVRIPEQLPEAPSGKWGDDEDPPAISPVVSSSKMSVYPNPSKNQFNVAWELEGEEAKLQFEVFDLTGRLVLSETRQATKNGRHVLNLGPCQGFYILRVSENGKPSFEEKLLCVGH